MTKIIENYLPFYLGQPYLLKNDKSEGVQPYIKAEYLGTNGFARMIVPLLRPLNTMTVEELNAWAEDGFAPSYAEVIIKKISSSHYHFYDFIAKYIPAHRILWIYQNGFDIFGLVAEGIALDRTKFPPYAKN